MGEELRFALRCQGSRQRPTLRRSCLRCTPPSHTYVPTNHDVPPLHGVRITLIYAIFLYILKDRKEKERFRVFFMEQNINLLVKETGPCPVKKSSITVEKKKGLLHFPFSLTCVFTVLLLFTRCFSSCFILAGKWCHANDRIAQSVYRSQLRPRQLK